MNHNIILFTHKGKEREICKDVCQYKDMHNAAVISLADGVSTQKQAVLGASRVQNDIAGMIADEVDLKKLNEEEIQCRVANVICKTLESLANSKKSEKTDFASTLLMLVFPDNADFYWTIHIGDGVIGVVDYEENIQVLSAPQNGITKQYTYTTVSNNLLKRIRVKKCNQKGDIFLMTDGIVNEIFKSDETRKEYINIIKKTNWRELEKKLLVNGAKDDIGFCCINY